MTKKTKKYYAVRIGRRPGVYMTWDECKLQTDGFSKNDHESFATYEDAVAFVKAPVARNPGKIAPSNRSCGNADFRGHSPAGKQRSSSPSEKVRPAAPTPIAPPPATTHGMRNPAFTPAASGRNDIYVAGCSSSERITAWAFVAYDGSRIIHTESGSEKNAGNVNLRFYGERLLGAQKAMEWTLMNDIANATLHHTYDGVSAWALGQWPTGTTPLIQDFVQVASRCRERIRFSLLDESAQNAGLKKAVSLAKAALERAVRHN